MRKRHRTLPAIFAMPLVIAVLSVVGLVAALTGDGWRDALAWAGLGVPVAAVAWARRARRS
ncbi:MAG: hypothetical protein ABW203_07600 [Novosphingobium sp.]